MKRLSLLLICLLTLFCLAGTAGAATPASYFTFDATTGTITKFTQNQGATITAVDVPSRIGGVAVTAIGYSTFASQKDLVSVTLPDSVVSVGSYAFSGCSNLVSLTLPSHLTGLGSSAFGNTALTHLTFPETLTTISRYVCYHCTKLQTVTFSSKLTATGDSAFTSCELLDNVTFPATLTTTKNNAFYLTGLTSLDLPGSVRDLGDQAFICHNLKKVTLHDGLVNVCAGAFANTLARQSITFPSTVKTLGESALRGATSLKSISLPEGLTSIGAFDLSFCYGLPALVIPSTVTSVGDDMPYHDNALRTLVFRGNRPTLTPAGSVESTLPATCGLRARRQERLGWNLLRHLGGTDNNRRRAYGSVHLR